MNLIQHRDMQNSVLLVFDLGKVFVDFDYRRAVEKIAPLCKVNPQTLYELIIKSNLFSEYESGLLTTSEFFARATEITGFNGTFPEFASFLTDIFTPIDAMVRVHEECKLHGFKTYLLSNTNELVVEHFRDSLPFFNTFDGYIFSYEHRALKPDERIYRALERQSGYAGGRIIYFDDVFENVQTALKLGWRAFVHKDAESTRNILHELRILT